MTLLLCLLLQQSLLVKHLQVQLLNFTAFFLLLPNHVFEVLLGPIILDRNSLHIRLLAVGLVQELLLLLLQLLEVGVSKGLLLLQDMSGIDVVSIHVQVVLNILILILNNLALHVMNVLLRQRHIYHPADLSSHWVYDWHIGGQLHAKLPPI